MAQSVKDPTLDLGSGYDLRGSCGFELRGGILFGVLSLLLSAPPLLVLSLSQINFKTTTTTTKKTNLIELL